MAGFDVEGARKAGYSDAEIQGYQKALEAGYKPEEIDAHLSGAPQGDSLLGVGKQLVSGAAQAVQPTSEGMLANPVGNIGEALGKGALWLANKAAPDNSFVKQLVGAKQALDKLTIPASKDPGNIASRFPDPQGPLEEGARNLGGMAVGGVAGGLGAMRGVVLPFLTSETLGQGARAVAPEYEPAARMVGAMAAGGGKSPVTASARASADADVLYDAARSAGTSYEATEIARRAANAKAYLERKGNSAVSSPSAHDTLDALISNKQPMSLTELEEQRQVMNAEASNPGKPGMAAKAARGVIDDVMNNPASTATPGSWAQRVTPDASAALIAQARNKALTAGRLDAIETLEHNAKINNNVNGIEINKQLKQQFGSSLKSADFMSRFANDPDLVKQMEQISKGAAGQGVAKKLGGGDLSKWRALELLGLAIPHLAPAVVGMRLGGAAMSRSVDANQMAAVARLKQAIAQKGGVQVTPGYGPGLARTFLGSGVGAQQ